jgi:hypothetical protein
MIIDFDKRNGGGGGSGYTLPVASSSVLGGIKVGQNMQIDSAGTLTANIDLSDYATIDPSTFSQPAIVIDGTESKFGYMNEDDDVAHFLVVHGDGLFDEWYDKTEDPETGDITWNSRGLVPIGGGDADKAYSLIISEEDGIDFYELGNEVEGINSVFVGKYGGTYGTEHADFQQDGIILKYNAYGYFAVNFHLESIGEEEYGTDITFDHQGDNKLTYTDPMTDGYVEMEYGDDNIFFEDGQVSLHIYYQDGIIEFYKASASKAALPEVVAQIDISGFSTEYVGINPYETVGSNNGEPFYPLDYKFVQVDGADHVNHVITTSISASYYMTDFNDNGILTLNINPSKKEVTIYKNDGSGDETISEMPCDIDLSDYIPDMAIKASVYEGYGSVNTAQVVLVCHDNYNLKSNDAAIDENKVGEVPSKFFGLISEARTKFYSIINTDNGAFVYEGKDNLTVKKGIEIVDQLPFIGVENKIYMLDNEYQSVSYQPSVCIDSDGDWQAINQVHDLSELEGNRRIEFDDEDMCCAVGDNGVSFFISDSNDSFYQDNQALAVVRIYGNAPEYKVKTFPAFKVSLANGPDNEPCYKVAWNFNFLGTDYDNEFYLPISGSTTEYVSGVDFDLSGVTEDTITIGTVNGDGSYYGLFIEGTEMYVTNGEYVCKDDFVEVDANEMSLYKYKGGRYYQVNGGDDIVTGTGVVVEESNIF